MAEKKYELRKLSTKDLFPMLKILSKIGIGEFRKCIESEKIKKAVAGGDIDFSSIGVGVMLEVTDIILKNIGYCEKEIYSFLADLSGMNQKNIPELEMAVFIGMITELVLKEEFKDFFTAVLKLIHKEK